jgi:hypothetical protein
MILLPSADRWLDNVTFRLVDLSEVSSVRQVVYMAALVGDARARMQLARIFIDERDGLDFPLGKYTSETVTYYVNGEAQPTVTTEWIPTPKILGHDFRVAGVAVNIQTLIEWYVSMYLSVITLYLMI